MLLFPRSRNFFAALALSVLSGGAHAATKVAVETTPERSRAGEPIQYRITIIHDGNDPIVPPRMPRLADFDLINSYSTPVLTSVIQNGRIVTRFKGEYVYTLKPLRQGKLKIPAIEFYIGTLKLTTDPKEILVDKLPGNAIARDPLRSRPGGNNLPGFGFQQTPQDNPDESLHAGPRQNAPRSGGYDPTVNTRESFFLRAEPSKTSVYQGELIVLSYALYQRDRNLDHPEIAKFPDFKGFLKEELITPKSFTAQPFELNNTMYLRSEIFRYAVFPLRAGRLTIEPMKFRADVITSPVDAIQRFMMGQTNQMPSAADSVIPMVKTSREVVIDAKPLPASPPDSQFTGAVGEFRLEVKGPTGKLSVGNPFSIVVTVTGKGNVKAIEAPTLKIPAGFELTRTPIPSYEFREDATGFKSFDYLIEPKTDGNYSLEALNWAYFDPEKAQYVTLNGPALTLQVEGGSSAAPTETKAAPEGPRFRELAARPGTWVRADSIGKPSVLGGVVGWSINGILFAFLSVVAVRRRRNESEENLFRRSPWEKTARRLRELKGANVVPRAILVDEWMRERLAGLLSRPDIHGESARDEIMDALKSLLHVEHHRQLEPLKRLWHELDLLRFTGASGRPAATGEDIFDRARVLIEGLVKLAPERDESSDS